MRLVMGAALLAMLGGCTVRDVKPSAAEMDRVEAALARQPCIGDLGEWQRRYYYHAKYFGEEVELAAKENRQPRASGHVRSTIGFALSQPAAQGAERESLANPPMGDAARGQEARRAEGSYDLRTDKLILAHCDMEKRLDAPK